MSATFDVRTVSPSRIGTFADCGLQFKFKYIDRVQPERNGAAALFGKVMHEAREKWVVDRSGDLIALTRTAWTNQTSDCAITTAFLREYQGLSGAAIRQEEEIRRAWAARGKVSKAPRMTKEWKESQIGKELARMNETWADRLAKAKYDFNDFNPLPGLFDESLTLAWKYGDKYRHLPNALVAELAFDFEWEGFRLIGFIDDISPLLSPEGERLGTVLIDAKTYRNTPDHTFKDWRQGAIYTLAARWIRDHGLAAFEMPEPFFFQVDKMRLLERDHYQFDDRDFDRLLRELQTYTRAVENEIYIPASKTCKADFCDFASQCAFHHGNAAKPLEIRVA